MTNSQKISLPDEASREQTAYRIRVTRSALGLKARQILEQTGIGRTAWSNYEKGISRPNIEDAIRFRDRFNISLDWIYAGDLSSLPFDLAEKIKQKVDEDLDENNA